MKFRQARDDRLVVTVAAVAMQLHEIREQQRNEVLRVRPLRVPRDLRALPRLPDGYKTRAAAPPPAVGCVPAPLAPAGYSPDGAVPRRPSPGGRFRAAGRPVPDHRRFTFVVLLDAIYITTSIDSPPHTSRIAVTSSADNAAPARRTSIVRHRLHRALSRSTTTGLRPGNAAKISCSRSSKSSVQFSKFMRMHTLGHVAVRQALPATRASCSESRVPDSSTCTRTFSSSGTRGFRVCSSRPKASGNASNLLNPGHVLNRVNGPARALLASASAARRRSAPPR